MESIFKDPRRLSQLLASIKVDYQDRPLTPIQVADELDSVCKNELDGDKKEAQRRFDLSESMWSGFMRLHDLAPEIQETIIWGASDNESLGLGFTAAHFMAKFTPEQQIIIMEMSWDNEKPLGKEEVKELHRWLNENPEKSIEDCIQAIFNYRPTIGSAGVQREVTHFFLSGLETGIFKKLETKAKKENIPLKVLAKEIFSRRFRQNAIIGVKPHNDWIRITFSGAGRRELDRIMEETGVDRNDIVNHIFNQEKF